MSLALVLMLGLVVVVSTGPINAPFFLAYGLAKGAYLGTEAMGSLAIYAAKALTHCCGRVPAQAASGSSCMASNCSSSICTCPCQ